MSVHFFSDWVQISKLSCVLVMMTKLSYCTQQEQNTNCMTQHDGNSFDWHKINQNCPILGKNPIHGPHLQLTDETGYQGTLFLLFCLTEFKEDQRLELRVSSQTSAFWTVYCRRLHTYLQSYIFESLVLCQLLTRRIHARSVNSLLKSVRHSGTLVMFSAPKQCSTP